MRSLSIVAMLAVVACSSNSSSASAPTSCKQDDRVGTYRLTFIEQSGTCGPIESQIASLNAGPGGAGEGCSLNSERWSEGDCKLERDLTCGAVRTVMVTRAQTADASEISGVATFTISGRGGCTGTYAIDAVRQ